MSHTPAPWHVVESWGVLFVEGDRRKVGKVTTKDTIAQVDFSNGGPERNIENARLIAAAPDLLDFAYQVSEHFERSGIIGPLCIRARQLIDQINANHTGASQ